MREGVENTKLVGAEEETKELNALSDGADTSDVEFNCVVADLSFARGVDVEDKINASLLVAELVTLRGRSRGLLDLDEVRVVVGPSDIVFVVAVATVEALEERWYRSNLSKEVVAVEA